MWRKCWLCVFLALGTLLLGACSGDDDDDDASADAPTTTTPAAAEPTTTRPPQPTTTTTVPPFSFDGSVAAPELVTTGEDFEAIYRSIDAYSTWLLAHNPDVDLIENMAPPGTQQYGAYEGDLALLAQDDRRYYFADTVLASVVVVDRAEDIVTLQVEYTPGERRLVASNGEVVDSQPFGGATGIAVLSADDQGHWRLVSLDPVETAEVEI